MALKVVLLGLSHKTAPVELRERLALAEPAVERLLSGFRRHGELRELAYLGTCNRVELLGAAGARADARTPLTQLLSQAAEVPAEQFASHLYYLEEGDAVRHVFLVASSLDSMVVGETEVLGQLKSAYRVAQQNASLGPVLHALFPRAFRVAKELHAAGSLGWGRVSVASVAVEFARHIFAEFRGRRALLVGAGEMARLMLEHLREGGLSEVLVLNRSPERARTLAREFAQARSGVVVRARGLEALEEVLPGADIVLVSTGAPEPVVTRRVLERALRARRGRPILVVDISVPRNVEPAAGELAGVYLYDIDDLRSVAEANQARRQAQAASLMERAEAEAQRFMNRLKAREVGPLVAALRRQAHQQAEQELADLLGRLGLRGTQEDQLRELVRRLVNRLLHQPTQALKSLSQQDDGFLYVDALRRLFNLPETED